MSGLTILPSFDDGSADRSFGTRDGKISILPSTVDQHALLRKPLRRFTFNADQV